MIPVGEITVPLAEAWRRFSLGNADKGDFNIILADLLDVSHHGQAVSFGVWLVERGSLDQYTLYCALITAKQEIGKHIVKVLNYDEQQTLEARRLAKAEREALRAQFR